MIKTICYQLETESILDQYVFEFIFNILGYPAKKVTKNPDIYYGTKPLKDCLVMIKPNQGDLIWHELVENYPKLPKTSGQIPFDLIHALGAFLTDKVNQDLPEDSFDSDQLLIFAKSFQATNQIAEFPIVNLYMDFLRNVFKTAFQSSGLPLWPDGFKAAIALSHDVDSPDKYAILVAPLVLKNRSLKENLYFNYKRFKAWLNRIKDPTPNDYWLFSQIMTEEAKYGFSSTFFTCSVNRFESYGTSHDVLYNIRTLNFQKAFEQIINNQAEIGLHTSYNACNDPGRFMLEKKRLEELAQTKVYGSRHHYWHLGKNPNQTFMSQVKAGLEYDSSLAFNEAMGFRRNIALPYYLWDSDHNLPSQLLELPVFLMDGNIFTHKGANTVKAMKQISQYISLIKATNGFGAVDWHVRTSYPANETYREWGKCYVKLLAYLAEDGEIWSTNLRQIQVWLEKRNKKLKDMVN